MDVLMRRDRLCSSGRGPSSPLTSGSVFTSVKPCVHAGSRRSARRF